jgi:membrane protein DedA with SNARE-associated domain
VNSKPSAKVLGWLLAAVAVVAVVGVLVTVLTEGGFGLVDPERDDFGTYFAVAALVFGDAVVAIFPGETTLNTASVLASDGELELGLVILAGFIGAWLGDNTLYWIARSIPALRSQVVKAQEDERFKNAIQMVSKSSFILVIVCRFLPFVRWGVIAGMGVIPMPYRRFVVAVTIGDLAWATYTCLMAYFIGTALADFPLASIALACASSAILLGAGYFIWRRVRQSEVGDAPHGGADSTHEYPQ